MVSFIVVAKKRKNRESYTKDYATKHEISPFDITLIAKETTKKNTQSIGIEEIKTVQEKIFFKPIKSPIKLIVIEDAQLLTPEAQNALLKILEEPPEQTHIILGTETVESLLPTILSRCHILHLEEEQEKLTQKMIDELNTFIQTLPDLSLGERLKYAEQLAKDKDKALTWSKNIIILLRENLLQTINQQTDQDILDMRLSTIKSLQSLHILLKTTNVNPRFAIEHTLLSL